MHNKMIALALAVLMSWCVPHAIADVLPKPTIKTSPVSFSAFPDRSRIAENGLFKRTGDGLTCRQCRLDCADEKNICLDDNRRNCGKKFSRCMKDCWKYICRP